MDLAKIRQKARQEQENRKLEEVSAFKKDIPEPVSVFEDTSRTAHSVGETLVEDISSIADPKPCPVVKPDCPSTTSDCRPRPRDPLEVILAGREAAGCDENIPLVAGEQLETLQKEYQEYLCFRVSDEIYGINIMDIKEIIKPREVTEVPRAPSFVSGVISLRGIIIPIIDMLDRLGLQRETVTGRERVIVVRHGESFSGLLVDEIIQVVHITNDCFEAAPAVLEGIDRDFVSGIGRADGRMIILLNLDNIADIHLY
ncbi:MAG: chemotaxis protein CheW [Geobacteraceae bacterium]|nr:chemotaxis protein CheW [Geobacteraceae bacterium]